MALKRVFEFHYEIGLKQTKGTPSDARREDLLLEAAQISNWDLAFLYAIYFLDNATPKAIGLIVGMDRPTVARCLRSLLQRQSVQWRPNSLASEDPLELSESGTQALLRGLRLWTCAKHNRMPDGPDPQCLLKRVPQNVGSSS